MSEGHRGLIAWQRAMDFAANCYALCRSLRAARHFSLASQIERAAISIAANIAEGYGRHSSAEFVRFLNIALGSLREVETLLDLVGRIGAGKRETLLALASQSDELGKVLFGLRKAALAKRNRTRSLPPITDP